MSSFSNKLKRLHQQASRATKVYVLLQTLKLSALIRFCAAKPKTINKLMWINLAKQK